MHNGWHIANGGCVYGGTLQRRFWFLAALFALMPLEQRCRMLCEEDVGMTEIVCGFT